MQIWINRNTTTTHRVIHGCCEFLNSCFEFRLTLGYCADQWQRQKHEKYKYVCDFWPTCVMERVFAGCELRRYCIAFRPLLFISSSGHICRKVGCHIETMHAALAGSRRGIVVSRFCDEAKRGLVKVGWLTSRTNDGDEIWSSATVSDSGHWPADLPAALTAADRAVRVVDVASWLPSCSVLFVVVVGGGGGDGGARSCRTRLDHSGFGRRHSAVGRSTHNHCALSRQITALDATAVEITTVPGERS